MALVVSVHLIQKDSKKKTEEWTAQTCNFRGQFQGGVDRMESIETQTQCLIMHQSNPAEPKGTRSLKQKIAHYNA